MKRRPTATGRCTTVGSVLVALTAGVALPLVALGGAMPAGEDTPRYTMACI